MDLILNNYNEISLEDLATPKVVPMRRSSIFVQDYAEIHDRKISLKMYEEMIKKENEGWLNLIQKKSAQIKESFKQKTVLDRNILTPEQQDFCNKRIDLVKFTENHKNYTTKAYKYLLKKEWVLKRQNYVGSVIRDRIDEKTTRLASSIYNEISQI